MRLAGLLSMGMFLSGGQAAPSVHDKLAPRVISGAIIEHCTVPGTVALTFDDGPFTYTSHVLDLLDSYGAKATFFINGDNWSHGIDDFSTPWPSILRRMIESGHQIASHTWSHKDLTQVGLDERVYQMQQLESALRTVIGRVPTYMRPPYANCVGDCLPEIERLGYHVVNFDVDTKDYLSNTPDTIQTAINTFYGALDSGGADSSFLVLSHDVHQTTAEILTPAMLEKIQERGYRAVTVGDCLGDPESNWYRA
ncbi:family 4 putative carbohydrate esterase [Podospora australis]|uniref:Family 4 putative carbohydrate esterase n=1 Tax=Podospora australis TaxID=1536484 RepID=A0AAN6WSA6_9PEZI|nr:family 4 putative carbohydrate esterase [Podospora australis]